MSADEFKAQGNAAFSAKDFDKAIDLFTKAIEVSPTPNHVLYSNRSACYASKKEFQNALNDAEECVKINPTWAKGYNRVGAAQFGLDELESAEASYKKALELDPSNAMAKSGLQSVEDMLEASMPNPMGMGKIFSDPMLITKLKANPKTASLMQDPELVAKVQKLQANPSSMSQDLFTDPRLMTVVATLLGIDLSSIPGGGPAASAAAAATGASTASASATSGSTSASASAPSDVPMTDAEPVKAESKKSAPEPETKSEPEEKDTAAEGKKAADEFKQQGNALYKQHKFDEAIEFYNKAWESHKDVTYLNNRAAAEFEKGDYETAIKTCLTAVEEGRDMRADYKLIAKSFSRIGNSYLKLDKLKEAIEYFEKSLTEHRTPDILNKLRATEREIKKRENEAYFDEDKAEEARLQGKEYFTKGDWPNAVKAYTEMVKRNPNDARGYSNRAAALAKLMSFPDAIRDCDEAIKRDPNFLRAFIRKANAQIAVKDFKGCLDTLTKAKDVDAKTNGGKSAYEIEQLTSKALSQRFAPIDGETQEQTLQRVGQDPEIQEILSDPVMNSILQQAQNNPAALQEHMKNPQVYQKIITLMAAGIIRTH
ncbi:hypothetical protein B5S28_g1884 [[Candida] boidinii]|nr:hypothetical protein B5S28_g1884 [[Candida] boidinii]OWB61735.1 hypothetical protein B5S29_g2638 [[Candida] boidinii]OWB70746.1 hypothetical protein B5S31_g425 [[Candida] boidinii]OWB76144.1 hypothetical protein B5S32_g294 [[Candida] boidinii]